MTAKSIVDIALDIIAERDGDGSRPVDIDYFNSRAVAYVNITLAEAAPVNSMLMGREIDFEPVSELTDEVACDPQVAYTALPYNLAALYPIGTSALNVQKNQQASMNTKRSPIMHYELCIKN